jgi:hypothetical protein
MVKPGPDIIASAPAAAGAVAAGAAGAAVWAKATEEVRAATAASAKTLFFMNVSSLLYAEHFVRGKNGRGRFWFRIFKIQTIPIDFPGCMSKLFKTFG